MECDGEKVEKKAALIAAVCNGTQFGGGICICPTAKVDDGKISVVVVEGIKRKRDIIKAFLKLMKGKILEHPKSSYCLCDELIVTLDEPYVAQLDGELYPNLKFHAKIKTGLKFYRP